jgi:hypothetical protein
MHLGSWSERDEVSAIQRILTETSSRCPRSRVSEHRPATAPYRRPGVPPCGTFGLVGPGYFGRHWPGAVRLWPDNGAASPLWTGGKSVDPQSLPVPDDLSLDQRTQLDEVHRALVNQNTYLSLSWPEGPHAQVSFGQSARQRLAQRPRGRADG